MYTIDFNFVTISVDELVTLLWELIFREMQFEHELYLAFTDNSNKRFKKKNYLHVQPFSKIEKW